MAWLLVLPGQLISSASTAQDKGAKAAQSVQNEFPHEIEEVIVVARRREEDLRDVPIASTVLSSQQIHNQSIRDLADIQLQTPNLQIAPFPAVGADANISMRGQSQFEPVITLDPAVGLYVDGVYMGRSTAALLNLVDLSRVEVLMGPQGTLYGRNTTGGVIHLISNKNRNGSLGGYLDLIGGDYSHRSYTGAIGFPIISDTLSARVSFRSADRDGFGRNNLLEQDLEDESSRSLRINLSWRPEENIEALISYDKTRQRERSSLFHLKSIDPEVLDPACLAEQPPSLGCAVNFVVTGGQWADALGGDERKQRSDVSSRHDLDVEGIAATFTADFEVFSLKSISAYRELRRRNVNDIDGTEWAILHPDASADQQQFSQEFHLYGRALDDRLDWLTGLYYFDEEGNDDTRVVSIPDLNPFSPSTIEPHGENTSYAVFGHVTYGLSDELNINLGLRYTWDQRQLRERQFNTGGCTLEFINRPPCHTRVSEDFGDWSYIAGLDYRWSEELMTYFSASRGFKSGGFNARASKEIEFEPVDPEKVDSVEVGLKSSSLDRRYQANLALYYSRYRDIQRAQLVALSPTEIASTVSNAAKATVWGGELQLTAFPAAGLQLGATLGLTEADYDEFDGIDSSGQTIDKSDLDFPRTPRWNYSARAQYTLPFDLLPEAGLITLYADYSWQSKIYNDVDNLDISQDSFGLLNLRLGLRWPQPDIEFALFVKNVTDEDYVTGGLDFSEQFGYVGVFLGAPRTYNAQLTWRFGDG
jgi:iron complex outermembrane receptor protein